MDDLYVFNMNYAAYHKYYAGGQAINSGGRCQSCNVLKNPENPVEISLNHLGIRGFVEYLWNSHGLKIFRQDLVELWKGNDFSGYEVDSIKIVGWYEKPKKELPEQIPSYFRLTPTSWVRLLEPESLTSPCPVCGFVNYDFPNSDPLPNGIQVDLATWDGSDFFGMKGYVHLFCTRPVVEATLEAGYSKHIAFNRLKDYASWENYHHERWTFEDHEEYLESFLIRSVDDL